MFFKVVAVGVPTDQVPHVLPESYGTVASVGDMLFREFLYPFEAISLLLLVAIVGGVVVSRSHQKEVAANRAADYRKQVRELASQDYPGQVRQANAARGRAEATTSHADRVLPGSVLPAVPDRDGRRAVAPERPHRADGHRAPAQRRQPGLSGLARALGDEKGHVFAFLIIAIAAAEAAVGLAILVGLFRTRQTIHLDEVSLMKR